MFLVVSCILGPINLTFRLGAVVVVGSLYSLSVGVEHQASNPICN